MAAFNEDLDEEELLKKANSIENLVSTFSLTDTYSINKGETKKALHLSHFTAKMLNPNQKLKIFAILESNMKKLYLDNGWSWNDVNKNNEIFHNPSHYLILHDEENVEDIVAYILFRFEWDDEEEPEYPVLYVYEVQLVEEWRSCGAGRFLVDLALKISRETFMKRIMLTCLKANQRAMSFYQKLGFTVDSNSPSKYGFKEVYEILSIATA